jgi:hypothetical protein
MLSGPTTLSRRACNRFKPNNPQVHGTDRVDQQVPSKVALGMSRFLPSRVDEHDTRQSVHDAHVWMSLTLLGQRSGSEPAMRPIRLSIDFLIIGTVAGALVLGLRTHQTALAERSAVESTRASIAQIEAEIGIRATLGNAPLNEFGHPEAVQQAWFDDCAPCNALASESAPWIEYALPFEFGREHPRDPTFRGGRGAMFWYNPMKGIVRARVPETASDEAARALYAEVNGTAWE